MNKIYYSLILIALLFSGNKVIGQKTIITIQGEKISTVSTAPNTSDADLATPAFVNAAIAAMPIPTINDATETVKGIVQLADNAETTDGTLNTKAVHPAGLAEALKTKIGGTGTVNRLAKFSAAGTIENTFLSEINNGYLKRLDFDNTNNNNNIAVGILPLGSLTTGASNTALGNQPLRYLTDGGTNTAIGHFALYSITEGNSNTALGSQAGRYVSAGGQLASSTNSLFLGANTRSFAATSSNEIVIGNSAIGAGDNTVTLGNSLITKTVLIGNIFASGNITTTANITSANSFTTSDSRLKKNVKELKNAIETVNALRPVSYEKKTSIEATTYTIKEDGFIAQEVRKVLPELVSEMNDADKTLTVNYTAIIPILTKAIQEQQQQIKEQQEVIKAQQAQIDAILKKIK